MNDTKYTESFLLPLTREEVETSAATMVKLMSDRDGLEAELDAEKKEAKSKIEQLEQSIGIHAGRVRTRSAYQPRDV